MKKMYSLITVVFLAASSFGQTFYHKTINLASNPVTASGSEAPYIAKRSYDNGVIFTYQYQQDGLKAAIVKLDSNFSVHWSLGFYIGSTFLNYPNNIIQTNDSGYVVAGTFIYQEIHRAGFLLKVDKNGNLLWEHHFLSSTNTEFYSLAEDGAGNIFAGGNVSDQTNSNLCVVKISYGGDVLYNKIYQVGGNDTYQSRIITTNDSGFALLGRSTSNLYMLKADSLGVPTTTKSIAGEFDEYDMDIARNVNKSVLIAVSKQDGSMIVFRIAKDGTVVWSKQFTNGDQILFNDMHRLMGGSIMLATTVQSAGLPTNISILKLNGLDGSIIGAKDIKTTPGYIFNSFRRLTFSMFSITGWDASASTDYLSLTTFDTSLQNCTDINSNYSVSDYALPISDAASTETGTLTELPLNATFVGYTNSTTISTACEIVLPVNLLRFTLTTQGSTNVLSWVTANEINVSYFEVQKSTDGRAFTAIGKVLAGKNGIEKHYQFTDANPSGGKNYYRLRITDADGKFAYSAVVSASSPSIANIVIYPIPVKDKIMMKLNSPATNTYDVDVIDMQGRVVLKANFVVDAGTTSKEINAALLKQGTYFVKIKSNEGSQVIKIVK